MIHNGTSFDDLCSSLSIWNHFPCLISQDIKANSFSFLSVFILRFGFWVLGDFFVLNGVKTDESRDQEIAKRERALSTPGGVPKRNLNQAVLGTKTIYVWDLILRPSVA